jgi:hypothetical protein
MYLITYYYKHTDLNCKNNDSYHYDIAKSVEDWLFEQMEYDDSQVFIINIFPFNESKKEMYFKLVD